MSDVVSRRALGPVPVTALTLAGLALVGFTGGAGAALFVDAGGDTGGQHDVSVHPATSQAGLTSTPPTMTPPTMQQSSEASAESEPATSTAPARSESSHSATSPRSHPATGSAESNSGTGAQPPARASVAPRQQADPQPYRPAPAAPVATVAPPPPPPPPEAAPPLISIPDVTLTRAPVIPQQPIPIREVQIG